MDLNHETVSPLATPLLQVWQYIGHDYLAACGQVGEVPDAEEIIEACIDADRLTTLLENGEHHQSLVRALIKEHGYRKFLSFLANEFPMA